jgi:hypothetical protein
MIVSTMATAALAATICVVSCLRAIRFSWLLSQIRASRAFSSGQMLSDTRLATSSTPQRLKVVLIFGLCHTRPPVRQNIRCATGTKDRSNGKRKDFEE